jgi:hypothetical protein
MPWTKENDELLRRGFLKMSDGSLISWAPPKERNSVDALVEEVEKLRIREKPTVKWYSGFEADVAEALYEWCQVHGGDPEKLIAECGFKKTHKK